MFFQVFLNMAMHLCNGNKNIAYGNQSIINRYLYKRPPWIGERTQGKTCLFIIFCYHCSTNSILIGYLYHDGSFLTLSDYHSAIRAKDLYLSIGILRLLPPFLLLRSVEPPFVYKQERLSIKSKKQEASKAGFLKKLSNCRIGSLITSWPTMIIRTEAKWHSHYGHHTWEMVQKVYQTNNPWNRRSHHEPACPPFAPSSWMALWLTGHQASIMAYILTSHNIS